MAGVVRWFERRGEIPLVPPCDLREYCPLTDNPDPPLDENLSDSICGVAFAIEYFDSHGWMSTRTIRCLAIDPRHPASVNAYCHVRGMVMGFRLDRIVSIIDLRTGRIVSSEQHLALLAPYLPNDAPGPHLRALTRLQAAARDGVFALLQIAMADGRLGEDAREAVVAYAKAEAAAGGFMLPPSELIDLWVGNLAPPLAGVRDSVTRLLRDKDKFARVLPWLLRVGRCQTSPAGFEESLRDLIDKVRLHFREGPHHFPSDIRATR